MSVHGATAAVRYTSQEMSILVQFTDTECVFLQPQSVSSLVLGSRLLFHVSGLWTAFVMQGSTPCHLRDFDKSRAVPDVQRQPP
jgi:hypothetical protein